MSFIISLIKVVSILINEKVYPKIKIIMIIETNLKLKKKPLYDLFFFLEYINFSSLLTFSESSKITSTDSLNLLANNLN